MSNYNWDLKKQRRDERIISINQNDIHTMYEWLNHIEKLNPLLTQQHADTIEVLEKGPLVKQRCEIWILTKQLSDIAMWYKYYPNPTDVDKETYAIIDEALNPKEKKPETPKS